MSLYLQGECLDAILSNHEKLECDRASQYSRLATELAKLHSEQDAAVRIIFHVSLVEQQARVSRHDDLEGIIPATVEERALAQVRADWDLHRQIIVGMF
jgi:hypothetical protein